MRGPRKKDDRPLEKYIQRKIKEYGEKKYPNTLEIRKFSQGNARFKTGDPDLIFFPMHPLRMWMMELKREGEPPTEIQKERIKRYIALGIHVYLVDLVEVGERIIDLEMSEPRALRLAELRKECEAAVGMWTPIKAKFAKVRSRR